MDVPFDDLKLNSSILRATVKVTKKKKRKKKEKKEGKNRKCWFFVIQKIKIQYLRKKVSISCFGFGWKKVYFYREHITRRMRE